LRPENHDPGAVSICKIIAAHCDQSGKIEYFKSVKKPHNLGRSEFFTDDGFFDLVKKAPRKLSGGQSDSSRAYLSWAR
jgi:hypothetical protein